jgi:hypothetical protein
MAKVEVEQDVLDGLNASIAKLKTDLESADKSKSEAEQLRERLKTMEAAVEKGQIKGMSESTAHALLEEIRALRVEMKPGSGPSPDAPKAGFWDGAFNLFD